MCMRKDLGEERWKRHKHRSEEEAVINTIGREREREKEKKPFCDVAQYEKVL